MITITLASCESSPPPSDGWLGTVDTTSSGVIHVTNPQVGAWQQGEHWRLVEEVRIGAMAGAGPEVFGEIAAVGVAPNGLIHVIDSHAQEVRVFDEAGRHVRSFGRRGGGPGEFADAYSLDWDASGRLWIVDHGNGRYAVFDSAGVPLFNAARTVPGVVFPWLGGIGNDGFLYDLAVSQDGGDIAEYRFYRIDDQGNMAGQLPPIEFPASGPPLGSMTLFWLRPRMTFAFDARGSIWLANTGEYRIVRRSLEGDTLRVIAREFTAGPITSEERDSIGQELRRAPPELRDPPVPDVRPAIARLFTDPDGRLYVTSSGSAASPQSGFDVFDEEGRFLGTMESDVELGMFPALPRFRRDEVIGITVDSLGVQYVVKARIVR